MMTYVVEDDENFFKEIDVKTHTLNIMRHLKVNQNNFYRLNASSIKQIRKLQTILELLKNWIFVEETFSDKTALSKVDLIKKQQPDRFTTHDQLTVIVSRSNDFGLKYLEAHKKAQKVERKERMEITKDLARKI